MQDPGGAGGREGGLRGKGIRCTKGINMRSHEKDISKTKSQPNEVVVIWKGGAAA